MSTDFHKSVSRAKVYLLTNHGSPFISTILFSLGIKESDEIPTAEVDGIDITINSDFFSNLNVREQCFVLAHEAWHVALQHGIRLLEKSSNVCPILWNEAGDHVINLLLRDAGFTLLDGVLCDNRFHGMSTDEVYKILEKEKPKQSGGSGDNDDPNSSGGSGNSQSSGQGQGQSNSDPLGNDVKKPKSQPNKQDVDDLKNKVNQIISKAATQAKMSNDYGNMPGEMDHIVDSIQNPKLPWDVIFMRYMEAFAKDDYSYRRPNRHYFPELYLPTLHSESLGEVVFAIDASISVSNEELAAYFDQIKYVHNHLNPVKTTIIVFDTHVRQIFEFDQNERIKPLEIRARGGTDFMHLFEELKRRKPVVAVVFSDMYCEPVRQKPRFPVVWIAVNAAKRIDTYFGKVIRMEV